MSGNTCPRTEEYCPFVSACETANVPLVGAVAGIKEQLRGDHGYWAGNEIAAQVTAVGTRFGTDLLPEFNPGGEVTVCPKGIFQLAEKIRQRPEAAAAAVSRELVTAVHIATGVRRTRQQRDAARSRV